MERNYKNIDEKEILKLVKLSKLFFNDEDLNKITRDMVSIINFAESINNADVPEIESVSENRLENLRDDVSGACTSRNLILNSAIESKDGFFVVRNKKIN